MSHHHVYPTTHTTQRGQTASCNLCKAVPALLCHRDLLQSFITGSGIVQTQLSTLLLHEVRGPGLPCPAGQQFPPLHTNIPPAKVSATPLLSSHMLLHAQGLGTWGDDLVSVHTTCTHTCHMHVRGKLDPQFSSRSLQTGGMPRTRALDVFHDYIRFLGLQGYSSALVKSGLTIRACYSLAGASVSLYKFPSRWLPAHPALLLSPFCLL